MENIQVERPFEKVEMVILGPFPVSTVGKKNIIAEVNYLVKWAKTRVTQSATTGCDAAKFFVKDIVLWHGPPEIW